MEAPAYQSQEEAITRKAKEKGVSKLELNAIFDEKIEVIIQEHPEAKDQWKLQLAESLVWEHLFPEEPFPGIMPNNGNHSSRGRLPTGGDWLHDKFQEVSPRKEHIPMAATTTKMRIGDYYNGSAARYTGSKDSYKPSSGIIEARRGDKHAIDSYKPKPETYASCAGMMLRKAVELGYTHYQYENIESKYHGEVLRKYADGFTSFHWLRWREELKIWRHLFDPEPFPGIEPEETIKSPRQDPSSRQQVLTPKGQSKVKSVDMEGSRLRALAGRSPQLPSCKPSARHSFTVGLSANIPKRPYNSQTTVIEDRARSLRIPESTVQRAYGEKEAVVKERFANESKDWQQYFVEASVWGRLFPNEPFPGQEPTRADPIHSTERSQSGNTRIDSFKTPPGPGISYVYTTQEKLMETKAKNKGGSVLRTQFFQFLNRQRHLALERWPGCSCYAKAWMADQITWQKFFKDEPFPVAKRPPTNHAPTCKHSQPANPPCISTSAPQTTTYVTTPKVTFGQQNPPAAVKLKAQPLSSQPTKFPANQPSVSTSASQTATNVTNLKVTFGQRNPPASIQSKPHPIISQPTKFAESIPPANVLVALAEARNARQLPQGALLMQNMEPTVCNPEFVKHTFQCLQSEDIASIETISTGLKCNFRYQRRMDGDLLLWVEPFAPGDLSAHNGGHVFLRGWIQRNMGFGIVKPSFYWNEIQNTASFKQVAMAPAFPTSTKTVSSATSDSGNGELRAVTVDSTSQTQCQNEDGAVVVLKGSFVDSISCSPAALKNLAFSLLDSGSNEVEQRLRCSFSVVLPEAEKLESQRLDLVVERNVGTEKSEFEKATKFVRAWALQAIQPTPCKLSSFLSSPKGMSILGRLSPVLPEKGIQVRRSGDPERNSLDQMINEEKARAEGSSRLVLDQKTGEVITLRELLHRYRASPRVFGSSTTDASEEGEVDEDFIEVTGTDGQMKNMEGKFVVVDNEIALQLPRAVATSNSEVTSSPVKELTSIQLEVGTGVNVTLEPVNGERKTPKEEPYATPLKNDARVTEASAPVNGKRKADEDVEEDRVEKKVCV